MKLYGRAGSLHPPTTNIRKQVKPSEAIEQKAEARAKYIHTYIKTTKRRDNTAIEENLHPKSYCGFSVIHQPAGSSPYKNPRGFGVELCRSGVLSRMVQRSTARKNAM